MRHKITYDRIRELAGAEKAQFPKYASALLNLANQYAQGTRPAVVGQMSELIQEFHGEALGEWRRWYLERQPDAVEKATERIWQMLGNLKAAIGQVDRDMVERWVEDLVIVKTFVGLLFQEAILREVARLRSAQYRPATPEDEAKGIDGFIGEKPVSIKPESYRAKPALAEEIECEIIYYEKAKDGIVIELSTGGQ